MSTALKCPNPSCPYLFDPSTVPPGVVLACPRCGMRFTLGNPAAAPPPSPAEAASTVAYPGQQPGYPGAPTNPGYPSSAPTATAPGYPPQGYAPPPVYAPPPGYATAPSRPAAPPTNPTFGAMTPDTARPDGEEGPQLPVKGSKLQTVLLVGVGIVALSAGGIAVWWKLSNKNEVVSPRGSLVSKDLNISIDPPAKPWVRDDDMKAKLDAPFFVVYRLETPEAYMAFGGRDYKTRSPRPSELRDGLLKAINKLLEPEWKQWPDEIEKKWLDQQATGFKFDGVLRSGGTVEGDALAFTHKGVAYWFLSWTGKGDQYDSLKKAFSDARAGCKLLELRKDWKEKQSSVVPFKGTTVEYTILDAEGIWTEESDEARVKAEDPKADKFLKGVVQRKGDFKKEAELLVLILDGGDPLATARAYIEAKENANTEARGKNTFTEVTGALEGDPTPNTVDGNAPHVLLESKNSLDGNYRWLHAISAISVDGKVVAVWAKCKWEDRSWFDTQFVQLVKSLRSSGP